MLVVITNQSGIARGYFKEEQLADVQQNAQFIIKVNGHDASISFTGQ